MGETGVQGNIANDPNYPLMQRFVMKVDCNRKLSLWLG